MQLLHLTNFNLKFNAKFDLQKHGYELLKLDLVTTTQANKEAYATMIMGYQKDLDAAAEAKDVAKMKEMCELIACFGRR